MRDNFDENTKQMLARRVGYRCSNPNCRKLTSGPQIDPTKVINIGVAAHITAASLGGKRYDTTMPSETRRSIDNGIWLCQNCAKLVDNDEQRYSVKLLYEWKQLSEHITLQEIENIDCKSEDQNYFLKPLQNQIRLRTPDFGVRADVQQLIETYAPMAVRVEKEVNWNRSKYKCYDASGNYLGQVKGKLGDRYWKDRLGNKHY